MNPLSSIQLHRSAFFAAALACILAVSVRAGAATQEIRLGGYKYINPLLECEMDETQSAALQPLLFQLKQFIGEKLSKKSSHVSVYFRDLNNGPWFGINENEDFSPASLLKVPLMMDYFKRAEKDPSLLSRKMVYDFQGGFNNSLFFPPSKSLTRGSTYAVSVLIRQMISYSDNDAFLFLISKSDKEFLNRTYLDLGIEVPGFRTADDFMSVRDYASFFRILFNASYLNKEMSEKALALLAATEFKKGLAAGLPENVVLAHKFGERLSIDPAGEVKNPMQFHDCGIVYYPKHPYLICVMTRGRNMEDLSRVVQEISSFVYQHVDEQYKNRKD